MFNLIDIILVSILGFFTIKGLMKGLISEILGLGGVLAGLIVATKYMKYVTKLIDPFIDVPAGLTSVIAYLLIFMAVQLVVQVVIHMMENVADIPLVGFIVKFLGAGVGAFKGSVIISLLVLLLGIVPMGDTLVPGLEKSQLFPYAQKWAPKIFNLFSKYVIGTKDFHGELKESLESLPAKQIDTRTQTFLNSLQEEPEQPAQPQNPQGQ